MDLLDRCLQPIRHALDDASYADGSRQLFLNDEVATPTRRKPGLEGCSSGFEDRRSAGDVVQMGCQSHKLFLREPLGGGSWCLCASSLLAARSEEARPRRIGAGWTSGAI
ncbi:MAG: hypothetical protein CME06_03355 [Gemmatimonadetes bacterium]|nr:hypothetical protein [Gemmatimonadota bacterium]